MKHSKAQASGAAAATLVAIIAALIVIYLLALSPEERGKILDGTDTGSRTSEPLIKKGTEILLSESPGRMYPVAVKEFQKDFSPVNLFIGEEAVELKRKDNLFLQRSLFSKKREKIIFEVVDTFDLKEILLNFVIEKADGRLKINLNGQEIFENEISSININPIELKKTNFLKQGLNELEFAVSSPGIAFWGSNEYSLKEITISATTLTRNTQTSSQTFVTTEEERRTIKSLRLRFNAECKQTEVGKLDIRINNYNLFSAVPDCGQAQKPIEFLPSRLISGENEVEFKTSEGRYLIDRISLTSTLRETKPRTFYFELEEKLFTGAKGRERDFKYFCDADGERILLEEKGKEERTGWNCDSDQTCRGNARRYNREESRSTVKAALCEDEEFDDDDFRYSCDDDDVTIAVEYKGNDEKTGWECEAGETCEGNFRKYDDEQIKKTVLAAICEDEGFGTFELNKQLDVLLLIRFEDDISEKRAQIRVNGHLINLDQRSIEFETNIRNFVEDGTNAIKIVPEEILDITEIEIKLES